MAAKQKKEKWITLNLPYGPILKNIKDYPFCREEDSFYKRRLNKSGTLIDMEACPGESSAGIFLIGDINENGGVCDDCLRFNAATIVKRYKIIKIK